jgi:hypothetical protein
MSLPTSEKYELLPATTDPFRWESLNAWVDENAPDPLLLEQLRLLASRPPGSAQTALRAFGRALNSFLHIGSYGKFVECPWNELVELYSEQVVRSRRFCDSPEASVPGEALPFSGEAFTTIIRQHSQNPCTTVTVRRRVEKIRSLCKPEEPILVLGDDDFLSVALAEAGYRDVTALDIDRSLIRRLEQEAIRRGVVLKARVQDFLAPLPEELNHPYRLVVFDPMCTVEGVRFFMDAAIRLSAGNKDTCFFLHTHLMSLLRPGLQELRQDIENRGLEVTAFYPAFNVYPVAPGTQRLLKVLLGIMNGLFLKSPALRSKDAVVQWFVSDALILRTRK